MVLFCKVTKTCAAKELTRGDTELDMPYEHICPFQRSGERDRTGDVVVEGCQGRGEMAWCCRGDDNQRSIPLCRPCTQRGGRWWTSILAPASPAGGALFCSEEENGDGYIETCIPAVMQRADIRQERKPAAEAVRETISLWLLR